MFMGLGASAGNGAPLLPILYVTANLAFNISALLVLRTSGEPPPLPARNPCGGVLFPPPTGPPALLGTAALLLCCIAIVPLRYVRQSA